MDAFTEIPQRGDTIVGNDVSIGPDAVIMPGVGISDGAVIGAHTVVTRNVGPYEIVVGNAGRTVRVLIRPFQATDLQTLLELSGRLHPARA